MRMKRLFGLSLVALFTLAASAWAGGPLCNCGIHCIVPPPPNCPDCSCPCEHRLHLCNSEHCHKLIEELCQGDCCARIKAARKLGHRLHADFCSDPEVLEALIGALQCDSCWKVREAAAWAIQGQDARTEHGVLALYISSRLDPHYLVRVAAGEALDILIIGRRECFTRTFEGADVLIGQLRRLGYKHGSDSCKLTFASACAAAGFAESMAPPVMPMPQPGGPRPPEPIPTPKTPPVKSTSATFGASMEFAPMPMPGSPLMAGPQR
jgi:hypothetical protein